MKLRSHGKVHEPCHLDEIIGNAILSVEVLSELWIILDNFVPRPL